MPMKKPILIAISGLCLSSVACSYHARGPEQYRDDTQALLESKTPEIKACYDELLRARTDVAGSVRVNFKVQEETGKIFETTVDPTGTTAPPELAQCVVRTIDGLQLVPPDERTGIATYTWDFQPEQLAPPGEPAPAPAG
jgi:hypothetical protein